MLEHALIRLFVVFFTFITWRKLDLGLFFVFLFLPSYLIRFKFAGLPSTLLEIMIWIIFLIWVSERIVKLDYKKQFDNLITTYKNNFTLFIASGLFLIGATISIYTSINLKSALGEWKAFYIEPFLLFIILITHIKTNKQIQNILSAIVLCGLATSILAIYQHFTGWMVPWDFWENRNTFRVTGWYSFPNGVGLFLAPIYPLAIYLFQNKWSLLKKEKNNLNYLILIISLLFIIFSPLAIFFAKSTGGLIGIIASIGLLLLIWQKSRKFILVFGIISLLIIIFMPTNSLKQELLMQDRSGQIRLDMWAETIEFLKDNPIKGAGLASYKTLIYPYRIDKWIEVFHHPHNIFLTIWVNTGIIGLFGFTWIIVWFYRVGLMNLKKDKLIIFLLATITAFTTTGLVDSPYIKNDLAIFFWILPALLIVTTRQKGENEIE
ncbi:MAG: hypothetical protein A2725_03065 [Candidatus Magasanikbacteria bacterium RIFCSPHIGHO2_01_FULL_33_34]|uniref:O-antigen ligase-related domain-containing protein n=1 Tax=Candidatus Magasanikbacteria bacterium RIFCSPHIGHO2_01_FULL_33_34 TaxID=1798671 RepID=A0A1F6LH88_9BACT|nr:MAG: hypothetical protein A2725_03065 [Candidatus Magasanikbacteria bacterium RIFCSPHIGHO2_01_FULL_33_34]OGH66113.1 MAG: hypothetical protein A3B83_00555 [Candidatus Magasanikbacteria bacterium RIFCSPHIGHO2_02_FULL_33_17]OGH75959.1 MAG: hypothetical protein A3A89_00465 [Candidatus Magasanikbacteria bacterium RIFCSPLOWO2_01_FULL_33_34]